MTRCVTISIFSSSELSSIRGFADEIKHRFLGRKVQEIRFVRLPYNDVGNVFLHELDVDAMILCHSIHNRRLAITDVMDALYDRFLANAATVQGCERIGIIVHDLPPEKIGTKETIENEMEAFSCKQPSTFQYTSMQIIGGNLRADGAVQLNGEQWGEIERLIDRVALMPKRQPFANTTLKAAVKRMELLRVAVLLITVAFVVGLISGLTAKRAVPPTQSNTTPSKPNLRSIREMLEGIGDRESAENSSRWTRASTGGRTSLPRSTGRVPERNKTEGTREGTSGYTEKTMVASTFTANQPFRLQPFDIIKISRVRYCCSKVGCQLCHSFFREQK